MTTRPARTNEPFFSIEQAGTRWHVDFGGSTFREVLAAFRAAFPSREGTRWVRALRRWSVPAGYYARLQAFAHAHYQADQVQAPPPARLHLTISAAEVRRTLRSALTEIADQGEQP